MYAVDRSRLQSHRPPLLLQPTGLSTTSIRKNVTRPCSPGYSTTLIRHLLVRHSSHRAHMTGNLSKPFAFTHPLPSFLSVIHPVPVYRPCSLPRPCCISTSGRCTMCTTMKRRIFDRTLVRARHETRLSWTFPLSLWVDVWTGG